MKKCLITLLLILVTFSFCSCSQNGAELSWQEQYDLGVRYLSEGNYEEAIIAFTAAIEIDPKRPEAYLGAAEVYIVQGGFDAAEDILRQGLALIDDASLRARLEELESGNVKDYLGRTTKYTGYNADGSIQSYAVYTYDENGDYERISYGANGNILGYEMLRSADTVEGGYERQVEIYDSERVMTGREVLSYDASGRVIRSSSYDGEGNLSSYSVRDYDENGFMTASYFYVPSDDNFRSYSLFSYGNNGELIQVSVYDADGALIEYIQYDYDENGNRVRENFYDANGELTGYSETSGP